MRTIAACQPLLVLFAAVLAAQDPLPVEPGFVPLFDGKDLSRHFVVKGNPASWKVVDGTILSTPGGDRIVSKETFGDFILRLEFKVSRGGNSGVFLRVPSQDDGAPWETGFEVQISNEIPPRDLAHCTGSLYGVEAVDPRPDERPEVWHGYDITCLGERIRVKVDGVQTVDAEARKNPRVQKRKLTGYIGLQDSHSGSGSTIEYRNIRVQRLSPDGTITGFTRLSADGRGWHRIKTGHGSGGKWDFVDGTWEGQQDPPGSGNGGINVTDAVFGDFEVVIEAKPDWGCDSGVFLRSSADGKCYQVLVDYYAGGNVGGIYGEGLGGFSSRSYDFTEERGKGIASTASKNADKNTDKNTVEKDPTPLAFDPKDWAKHWSVDGYNEIRARITSNPPVVDVWLNGTHLTHFADTEKRLPEKGHLGIQVHGGKSWPVGAKVRYKSVQVREIVQ